MYIDHLLQIEFAPDQPSHQPEETSEFVTDPPESSLPDPTKVNIGPIQIIQS